MVGDKMKRALEDVILVVVVMVMFFTIVPVIAWSQSTYDAAYFEYIKCDNCQKHTFFNGYCNNCDYTEEREG